MGSYVVSGGIPQCGECASVQVHTQLTVFLCNGLLSEHADVVQPTSSACLLQRGMKWTVCAS